MPDLDTVAHWTRNPRPPARPAGRGLARILAALDWLLTVQQTAGHRLAARLTRRRQPRRLP